MLNDIVACFKATFGQKHQTRTEAKREQAEKDKPFYSALVIDGKRRARAHDERAKKDRDKRQ
ncbi:hypothetical protein [Mesorhizobium sp.]|uniref:hypothetical protein n=1 Tax=Mesorhizobium sp. TaxID=1871066 RepID=UPI00120F347E|nr:hypothetical protein [Mesorhizobium sp.]TIN77787.1 MAG: hypothetical protein E5Y09_16630 [Mesorhizobium sp.]